MTSQIMDFNDMAVLSGLDSVKQCIEAALPVSQRNAPAGMHMIDLNKSGNAHASPMAPEPLPSLPKVLPFDYSYLPDALRGCVKDISERMQCPPDFAAVGMIVMMAALLGRKVGIRPMRQNDWTVIPNLWGAVIGNSGMMKSPTLNEVLAPIKKLQALAFEEYNTGL